jgi:hypothetical protein
MGWLCERVSPGWLSEKATAGGARCIQGPREGIQGGDEKGYLYTMMEGSCLCVPLAS